MWDNQFLSHSGQQRGSSSSTSHYIRRLTRSLSDRIMDQNNKPNKPLEYKSPSRRRCDLKRFEQRRAQGARDQVQRAGDQVKGAGDQVQGAGDQVQGAGDQVQGAEDQTQGAGDQVKGAGDQVRGAGQPVHGAAQLRQRAEHPAQGIRQKARIRP